MLKVPIFLSWSGPRAKAVGQVVRDWLPLVLPQSDPWLSADDIPKGAQWLAEINKGLATCKGGLIFITPENQSAEWVLFEAGAIFKAIESRYCCPILCGLKDSDVKGPLSHFQATNIAVKEDMWKLVCTLNSAAAETCFDLKQIEAWFEGAWPKFASNVESQLKIASVPAAPKPSDTREIVEQVLLAVRSLERQMSDLTADISQRRESRLATPACDVCGTITVRSGSRYKCGNCGYSMGQV